MEYWYSDCYSEYHQAVLKRILFLITISDINKDISSSKLISFADDTRIYSKIADVSDCDNLQFDLNMIYDWAITNNMFFNAQKFHYVSFNTDPTGNLCNVYINPKMDIIHGRPQEFFQGGANLWGGPPKNL